MYELAGDVRVVGGSVGGKTGVYSDILSSNGMAVSTMYTMQTLCRRRRRHPPQLLSVESRWVAEARRTRLNQPWICQRIPRSLDEFNGLLT